MTAGSVQSPLWLLLPWTTKAPGGEKNGGMDRLNRFKGGEQRRRVLSWISSVSCIIAAQTKRQAERRELKKRLFCECVWIYSLQTPCCWEPRHGSPSLAWRQVERASLALFKTMSADGSNVYQQTCIHQSMCPQTEIWSENKSFAGHKLPLEARYVPTAKKQNKTQGGWLPTWYGWVWTCVFSVTR